MASGFTISRFVVIQSLAAFEAPTGNILVGRISALLEEYAPDLSVVFYNCSTALEFRAVMTELTLEASVSDDRPVLHLECHGSPTDGLEFENGSVMSWDECSELFTQLNIATRFNLFIVLAACYGAYLNGKYSATKPSPAFCIVAPTGEIDPGEVIRGFNTFYTCLLKTGDAAQASDALTSLTVSSGRWFSQLAEHWYVELVENFVKCHLNHENFDRWTRSLSRRLRDAGKHASVGSVKRNLVRKTRAELSGKYFDCFFCISQVPECETRFHTARLRVQHVLSELRVTGLYAL